MSVLSELSSATGDKNSNTELVKRCLTNPPFIHSIAEGLRTGTQPAQEDCMEILLEVARRRGEVLASFVSDFRDATKHKSKKLARKAYGGLKLMVHAAPSEVFAEREQLLATAETGGAIGLAAAAVLAELCAHSANYRGKLLVQTLRLLKSVPLKDLVRWTTTLGPAVAGSADSIDRMQRMLAPRIPELDEAGSQKMEKALLKIQRSTGRKH